MAWTERQHRMLRAMGLRVWSPPASGADTASAWPDAGAAVPAATAEAAIRGLARPEAQTQARHEVADPVVRAAEVTANDAATQMEPTARLERGIASQAAPAAAAGGSAAHPPTEPGGDARAQAIAALDWPELREAVAACTACGLCRSRRQTVFGVGHAEARWMIVGEAPGEQEDLKGEPFVGPAGQLLDNMLRALRLTRAEAPPERQVYIANTLKCRPPRNRNPEPEELALCEPFLQRQIALVRPRLILAMGRFAVQALLRSSEPVGRLRGRIHRYEGVPLIVTYHPAYLLRNPADKARSWDDLCLAAQTAGIA